MHLDDGEVPLAVHVHVPAGIVQSDAPSADLSEVFVDMSLRSPRLSVGYFLAWLDRSFWVNRRFDGRQLGEVQKPATHRVS